MAEQFEHFIRTLSHAVWGLPLVVALVGTSIYFSCRLKFVQLRLLKSAMEYLLGKRENESGQTLGDISHFASLCTALSATIGTGNIVGVALAMVAGGPGALFWMWIAAFFGMAVKYAEGFLAVKYRQVGEDKKIAGGPMYYIEMGLGSKILAKLFAFFGVLTALLGIGTWTQANAIAAAVNSFGIPNWFTAMALAFSVAAVTVGGIHRIAYVSEKIVPFMSIFYIGAAILVLIIKLQMIPQALRSIVIGAFSPEAVLGGGAGVSMMLAVQLGISRGIFSHESGLGSAAIAAAAARTNSPAKQGLVAMLGAFFSTIICTMTGLVLVVTAAETGVFTSRCAVGGALLTSHAFGVGLGMTAAGQHIVNIGILFFAFTTIIGWNYYGEKCVQYLWGDGAIRSYNLLFLLFVIIGPFYKIDVIFTVADVVIGLMAIPNLVGLVGLRKVIIDGTRSFMRTRK
ncbi:MAG: sodium:alanine symporter family protein [Holosporaceae bacterium]|nr:sodium:alanine symporter family protein [Holosporaceae bacterium]